MSFTVCGNKNGKTAPQFKSKFRPLSFLGKNAVLGCFDCNYHKNNELQQKTECAMRMYTALQSLRTTVSTVNLNFYQMTPHPQFMLNFLALKITLASQGHF